jgi:hypothetical protein
LPRAALLKDLAIGRDAFIHRVVNFEIFGEVSLEPIADFATERLLLRCVFEVPRSPH